MKKLFLILLLTALLLCLALPAAAQQREVFVLDPDGFLVQEDVLALNETAAEISARYNCGVYAAVFGDMGQYGYSDIEAFSEAVYHELELGYSEGNDGILLVLSMAERDYDLTAYGDFANTAVTDYGRGVLSGQFLDNFRSNDWAGGFSDYINYAGELLGLAAAGEPLDVSATDFGGGDDYEYAAFRTQKTVAQRLRQYLPAGIIVGLCASLIYCSSLKRKMKSTQTAMEADRYVCKSGVRMTSSVDKYSHSTVVRQHIEHSSSSGTRSGSGGGGTHVNSSGFSHSSGKF